MSEILKLFDDINPVSVPKKLKYSDWKGSSSSVFMQLAASAHTDEERQAFDYYATHPIATELLLGLETFNKNIWEPCCGEGHISKVLIENGFNVKSTDIIDRGYGEKQDFLSIKNTKWGGVMSLLIHHIHLRKLV